MPKYTLWAECSWSFDVTAKDEASAIRKMKKELAKYLREEDTETAIDCGLNTVVFYATSVGGTEPPGAASTDSKSDMKSGTSRT